MKQPLFSLLLLLFFSNSTLGQNNAKQVVKGKVISSSELENIYIINLKTEASATTEKGGYFTIKAAVGDTLLFSAFQIKSKKVIVPESDFSKDLFFVKLETVVNQLDEVKIFRYKNIDAVSLGIISPNTKHYTPAERKLKTASDLDGKIGLGGSMSIDPLLNMISGRTAMLKKEVEVEKKEFLMQKLENWFENNFYTEKLKIPVEYVKGFWYFAVEDSKLVSALNDKNKTMATFVLGDLATKYIALIKDNK